MRKDFLEVNGRRYAARIFFDGRERSSVSIGKKGVTIRIPHGMNRNEQFRTIFKLKMWAKERIEKNPPQREPVKEYANGESLKVGDTEYLLDIYFANKQSSSARLMGNKIYLSISSELPKETQNRHISSLLSRLIARQRISALQGKINSLNERHFQQKINKIFFKNHKSKWGSCSSNKNINISTRLLFAPDDVLEYICIHELAHLLEHNHSDKFWQLVEKAMPNYNEKEEWLKQNGKDIVF